jgi:glycosyltransferase involved in cell wall biosynthesis
LIRVTVIVPARDAEATLPSTLAALADQEAAPSFEVVVADDGSGDATPAIAERSGARVIRGHANAAVAAASGAVLAFCGADCRPAAGWLASGTRALAEADLVQGRILPDRRQAPGPFERDVSVTAETGLYDAGNLFVSRALFDRLGGFERPPGSGEGGPGGAAAAPGVRGADALTDDTWFAWRARRSGGRTAFCHDALTHRAARPLEPLEYLEQATRLRAVPENVARLPELRDTLLHRRVFLSPRTMKLDLALAGLALAAARRSRLPLLAAVPYALELRRHSKERGGEDWKRVAAIDAATDLLGALALLHGSVESRAPVL